ncbi:UNVERIFIED_CONTAM: hypothetical protein Sradi_7279600 [Sesamum radiatum]|uniref:Uncharacterized protein n=1 Tax=Sesamum radiatum TaxID=300843 RepID=A0AAW2II26_SESRA
MGRTPHFECSILNLIKTFSMYEDWVNPNILSRSIPVDLDAKDVGGLTHVLHGELSRQPCFNIA